MELKRPTATRLLRRFTPRNDVKSTVTRHCERSEAIFLYKDDIQAQRIKREKSYKSKALLSKENQK